MALSGIKTITFVLLLMATTGKICASSNPENLYPFSGIDSLNLPPLNKFVGQKVEALLGLLNPQNYEKSYIVTPQGMLQGIIVRFKISDVTLHIYLADPTQYNAQSVPDSHLISKDHISRIEVFNEDKFITVFNMECLSGG